MHVSPEKYSYVWLPRKCDYQESVTTGQTDAGQSDPYVPLCFAGDTKTNEIIIMGLTVICVIILSYFISSVYFLGLKPNFFFSNLTNFEIP